jgi:hypothetical protein
MAALCSHGFLVVTKMNALLLYCWAGYENDCAVEIITQAAHYDISGYCRAKPVAKLTLPSMVRLPEYPQILAGYP